MTDITIFQSVVLGALQGFAEFLPISSSAHLALAPWAFGWPEPGLAFDVALHAGTLIALLWYFRAEWVALCRAGWEVVRTRRVATVEQRRVMLLVAATIPGGIAGVAFKHQAETIFRAPALTAAALIAMGLVLWIVDLQAPAARPLSGMRWRDAILIGCAQAFAIIPGVSRSGATITAGRALGLDRQGAAVFSFLMAMPIIAAAAVLEVPKAIHERGFSPVLLAGVFTSAITGWLAIAVLLRFIQRNSFAVFAVYRLLLGAAVLWLVFARG